MTTKTIEIDDTLHERVEMAVTELKDRIRAYLIENPDTDDLCLSNDIDYDGSFHEIVDGCVPIYYSEIDDSYYLYGNELDQAFEDAGVYSSDERPDNYKQVCIFFYIEQQCWEWWNENHTTFQDELNGERDTLTDGGYLNANDDALKLYIEKQLTI